MLRAPRKPVVPDPEEQAIPSPSVQDDRQRCPNCGTTLQGRYCHRCGERALEHTDYSLTSTFTRLRRRTTRFGERTFRTFLGLFFRPGLLTDEYVRGRRIRYLRPLSLFLVANVCYFFFASWTGLNPFHAPLYWHADAVHTPIAKPLVEGRVAESSLTFMEYSARFDARAEVLSKLLLIGMVPLFALLLLLAHVRRDPYFARHLLTALHFFAFLLFLPPLLWALMGALSAAAGAVLGESSPGVLFGNEAALVLAAVLLGGYLFVTLRRLYQQPTTLALLKSVALVVGLYYVITAYRVLLFFVTFYSL